MTFSHASVWLARQLGRPAAFFVTLAIVLVAIGAGAVPAWSQTINGWGGALTGYIGVLLLLVLQNSTNREAASVAARLDELLHATEGARDELIQLEERDADEIAALRQRRE